MDLDEIGKCDQDTRLRIVEHFAEIKEQICQNKSSLFIDLCKRS
jgi:hypothetical protein